MSDLVDHLPAPRFEEEHLEFLCLPLALLRLLGDALAGALDLGLGALEFVAGAVEAERAGVGSLSGVAGAWQASPWQSGGGAGGSGKQGNAAEQAWAS